MKKSQFEKLNTLIKDAIELLKVEKCMLSDVLTFERYSKIDKFCLELKKLKIEDPFFFFKNDVKRNDKEHISGCMKLYHKNISTYNQMYLDALETFNKRFTFAAKREVAEKRYKDLFRELEDNFSDYTCMKDEINLGRCNGDEPKVTLYKCEIRDKLLKKMMVIYKKMDEPLLFLQDNVCSNPYKYIFELLRPMFDYCRNQKKVSRGSLIDCFNDKKVGNVVINHIKCWCSSKGAPLLPGDVYALHVLLKETDCLKKNWKSYKKLGEQLRTLKIGERAVFKKRGSTIKKDCSVSKGFMDMLNKLSEKI